MSGSSGSTQIRYPNSVTQWTWRRQAEDAANPVPSAAFGKWSLGHPRNQTPKNQWLNEQEGRKVNIRVWLSHISDVWFMNIRYDMICFASFRFQPLRWSRCPNLFVLLSPPAWVNFVWPVKFTWPTAHLQWTTKLYTVHIFVAVMDFLYTYHAIRCLSCSNYEGRQWATNKWRMEDIQNSDTSTQP